MIPQTVQRLHRTEFFGIHTWIYGHHHYNSLEFVIGNTHLLTNQLGYIRKREYYGFRKEAVITL